MQNVSAPGPVPGPTLRYFFSAKDDLLVISLSGVFDRGSAEILKECLASMPTTPLQFVIFNLADVSEADRPGASEFIRFQKELRERPLRLKVCAMSPGLKEVLDGFGALRSAEVAINLVEAIKSLRHPVPAY
jgi:anti-anti-sigma regulatory factor